MDEDAFDTNEEILAGSGIDRSAGGRKRKASEVDGDLIDGNTKDSDDGVGKHNFECRIQWLGYFKISICHYFIHLMENPGNSLMFLHTVTVIYVICRSRRH